jgi:hypothetical protein
LWRLRNGEAPTATTRAVVIWIGTNDLGAFAQEGQAGLMQAADQVIKRCA